MLTGDKYNTAVQIAKSCNLISSGILFFIISFKFYNKMIPMNFLLYNLILDMILELVFKKNIN